MNVKSLNRWKASIDLFDERTTHCCQLISSTVTIGFICFGITFETLQRNISESHIWFCHPLKFYLRTCVENYHMSCQSLVCLIGQGAHHSNTIFLINLYNKQSTGFSRILLPSAMIVSPHMSKSHYFLFSSKVFNKSVTFPLQVSCIFIQVRGCIERQFQKITCQDLMRSCSKLFRIIHANLNIIYLRWKDLFSTPRLWT